MSGLRLHSLAFDARAKLRALVCPRKLLLLQLEERERRAGGEGAPSGANPGHRELRGHQIATGEPYFNASRVVETFP